MNTQNDLILISMHTLKAFTSVLRVFLLASENPQFNWGFKKALAMSRKNKPPMLK
jgi:hypothetical protein